MGSRHIHSTGESWKDLASRSHAMKAGTTVRHMAAFMNETYPFADALGILDNGCGTGTIISYILDHYAADISGSATILAADYSEHMLESLSKTKQSKSKVNGDVWDRLELRNIDAHDLSSIPTESMTHVTGGHLYFLLEDSQKALKETLRVLSPGGVLGISSGKGSQHLDALTDAFDKIRPSHPLKLIREPWSTEPSVKQELEAIGFVDVTTCLIESQIEYEQHQALADMLLLMPVMKNATQELDESQKSQLSELVVENLKSINPAEPGNLKGTSIVAFARKETSIS